MSSDATRTERFEMRLSSKEREAFQLAADLSGSSISTWIRDRLRRIARRELEEADLAVPFLPPLPTHARRSQ